MDRLLKDIRYGVRGLLKRPGFTVVAVITLALGIGANTAIFSVVNAVLLRPLPFVEPERLLTVWNSDSQKGGTFSFSWPDFSDFRAQTKSFERLAAFDDRDFTLSGLGTALRLKGAITTADLIPLLGVAPQLGRGFLPEEDLPGTHAVVLSDALWRHHFNSDQNIIGQSVTIDEKSFTVVGVMPEGFSFPIRSEPVEIWSNAGIDGEGNNPWMHQRDNHVIQVIGRLKPGVTAQQAQAEGDGFAVNIATQYGGTKTNLRVRVVRLSDRVVGDIRLALLLLSGAVGCVLLIACANVANLLLARAGMREREFAIRAALGATRRRMAGQLLIESLLLALCGGAIGLSLGAWGTRLLVGLAPQGLPRIEETALDLRVLSFTFLVTLLTGLLFGLVPTFKASKIDLTESLRKGGLGAGDGLSRHRLRTWLVVTQTAVSLVLLVGAGLLINSFRHLQQVDPGFDPKNILTLRVSLPDNKYDEAQVEAFYQQLISRVGSLPGVTSVSAATAPPLTKLDTELAFDIEGSLTQLSGHYPVAFYRVVRPDYFRTLNITLLQGRDFDARDADGVKPVAIVNETLARRYFPNQSALGQRLNPGLRHDDRRRQWREIIGVVKDVRHARLSEDSGAELYVPQSQKQWPTITVLARTNSDPHSIIPAVRREVAALDHDVPVYAVVTMEEYWAASLAQQRFQTLLLSIFAAVALLLTAVGLYGLMSNLVVQRTREIGIRMALGAQRSDVLRLVIKNGMRLVLAGLAIGLVASSALTRLMTTLLFGVTPTDTLTFAGASLSLVIIGLPACYIPARRATKVDPLVALRYE